MDGFGDRIGRLAKLKDCRDGQDDDDEARDGSRGSEDSSGLGASCLIRPASRGAKLKKDERAGGGGDLGEKKLKPRGAIEANSSNSVDVTILEIRSKKEFVTTSLIRGTLSGTASGTNSSGARRPGGAAGGAGVKDFGESFCDLDGAGVVDKVGTDTGDCTGV